MAKRILLVADHIGQDGTGRFITYLANGLSQYNDLKVSLMLFHNENYAFYDDLDKNVNLVELSLRYRIRYSILNILKHIKSINPDICVVLYTQLVYLSLFSFLLKKRGIKFVFRETIIPSLYRGKSSWLSRLLCRISYQKYDHLISQSRDMANDLISNWGCDIRNIQILNNPVSIDKINKSVNSNMPPEDMELGDKPVFLSAGRLTNQKGYDIILHRLGALNSKIPFKYYILGEGEDKDSINALIKFYNLEKDVKLLGFRANPYSYIANCDALILSSRYEGFPNIVLEANSLGKPVFSNTCPGGINEIILNGENGVACDFNRQDSFVEGLNLFLNTNFDSKHIIEMTWGRYDQSVIIQKYKIYLCSLID